MSGLVGLALVQPAWTTAAMRFLHCETLQFRGFIIERAADIVHASVLAAVNRLRRIPEVF